MKCKLCQLAAFSRGLCRRHYNLHYKAGTLDEFGNPSKFFHSIDQASVFGKMGKCSGCGESTPVRWRGATGKGGGRWVCENTNSTNSETMKRRARAVEELPPAPSNCEICGKFMTRPCIDHDHETNKLRGWLCVACNTGLGMFHDSPEIMARAIEYIGKSHP